VIVCDGESNSLQYGFRCFSVFLPGGLTI
jgi:hypothetical protein